MKFWVTDGIFHREKMMGRSGQLRYEDRGESFEIPEDAEMVVIPKGTTTIAENAFYSSPYSSEAWENLKAVVLPDGLQAIHDYAFYGCANLEEVSLPESLIQLGKGALSNTGIRSITIPESVQEIGQGCFNDCVKLEAFHFPKTPVKVDTEIICGCSNLKSISVPDYIRVALSFKGCASLETITIPHGIGGLMPNAFKGCSSLKEAILPDTLWSDIHRGTFQGCTALQKVIIPSRTSFEDCTELHGFINPNAVRHLSVDFAECKNLCEVSLGEGVQEIMNESFMDCNNLHEIALPSTIRNVGARAFAGCSQLSKVVVKGSLKEFASTAFQKCPALKEVYISEDQAKDARKLFGAKAKLFALDGTPIEGEKLKAPAQSVAKSSQDQEVLDRIAKSIKLTKLLQWAERKGLVPGAVKFADSSKKPPKEVALFILYAYMSQLPKLPAYHADSYKKDIVALEIVPEADAIACLLDRESLLKVLAKTTPSLVIQYYADKDFEKAIKLTPNKPLAGSEKAEKEKLDVYYTWKVSFVNADFLLPYCRYAREEQIKVLITTAGKLMRDWGRTGRQASIVYRSALLLSDTQAAMEFAEKNGNLALYAKVRGTTPDTLRKAAATKTGLNASGNLKFDL